MMRANRSMLAFCQLALILGFSLLHSLNPACAQARRDPNAFYNGVAYTFERKFASVEVNDAHDHGQISIAVNIWRPIENNRHEVVLFSHGSLGGMSADPHEPINYIPAELVEFLVRRGYTVVQPTRRGLGESTGTFIEECAFLAGKCTLAEYRALAEPGLAEAVRDSNAVIDQVIEGAEVPKGSKILFVGISRGGLLSLRMAAERPDVSKGVINFVGGWLSIRDEWPEEENAARIAVVNGWFHSLGSKVRAPSIWIYAARDPFYSENITRGFFAKFTESGGKGQYLFIREHSLRIGHIVATDPKLWSTDVDKFLHELP